MFTLNFGLAELLFILSHVTRLYNSTILQLHSPIFKIFSTCNNSRLIFHSVVSCCYSIG